ncbi:MAG: hypothetical protein ABIS86_17020 [Streptosporangiaceae bacterium]
MSAFVLTNCTAWADAVPLTTYSNEMSLKQSVEDKDVTTFGSSGWKSRIGGLKTVEADMKGFWDLAVDPAALTGLGVADQVYTFTGTGVETDPAWFFQAANFSLERFGSVGDVDPFSLNIMGTNNMGLITGQLAKARGAVAAAGALGSGLLLGAPTATQYVYAALHVFTAGTTITVAVQSDDNAGFTTPTTRGTIGPVTTTGGVWMARVAGPFVGETYWRLNVTAITGSFNVGASIGIA